MTNPVSKDQRTQELGRENVQTVLGEYQSLFEVSSDDSLEVRKRNYMTMVNHFYDFVTDFYVFGWGQSFHFAPRKKGESFKASIARCECTFADRLGLAPGMTVLDVGSGVGGPMREIARHSGVTIVGINNNQYQIAKTAAYDRKAGLDTLCSSFKGDFMNIPAEDGSFDAAYCFEATPHAPDKVGVFSEVFRVLKPGGRFVGHEWCLTETYDSNDPDHRRLKASIEVGTALPDIATMPQVVACLEAAGFAVLQSWNAAADSDPGTPWYRALQGRDLTLGSLPRIPIGRWLIRHVTRTLEVLRIAPTGTSSVSAFLNQSADDLVEAGEVGIFTPLFFFDARKPA